MKILISGLLMATAFFMLPGCEKEINRDAVPASEKILHVDKTPAKVPTVQIAATIGSYCGSRTPCGASSVATVKNNQISITNNSQAWFPSLTYTYYLSIGGSPETFVPITGAQYTCNAFTSHFASGALTNGTRILVFANDPSSPGPSMSTNLLYSGGFITNYPVMSAPSNYLITTLGNFKGQSCLGDPK